MLDGTGFVGIATSRLIGNRPRRNRVRRRVREAVRIQAERLVRWDCVVIAKSACAHAEFAEICRQSSELIDEMERRWAAQSESF